LEHAEPIHLRPTAPLAERVLLPGDPGRALALAQLLIERPRMFNHHRGLWGYTGLAALDGEPLTIQATGMGGPSAAIVLHELIELGARRAIRVGTCGALDPSLGLGDLVVAREAIAADGASVLLSGATPNAGDSTPRTHADAGLATSLGEIVAARARPSLVEATIVSTDLFYEADTDRGAHWRKEGAAAVEMEASALFAVGAGAGIEVACLLAVSDVFDESGARTRIDDHGLLEAAEEMGRAAVAALCGRQPRARPSNRSDDG
jgi:DeoD family purine-nucleoside phosphorylase